MLYRFFVGLGVVAMAVLSACANPVGDMADDPTHPASPNTPPAPAFTFSHSLLDAGAGPEPGPEMSAGSGAQMDHGQHGGAPR